MCFSWCLVKCHPYETSTVKLWLIEMSLRLSAGRRECPLNPVILFARGNLLVFFISSLITVRYNMYT